MKYTIPQASRVRPISVRTLRQYIRDGKVQAVKNETNYQWLIPESEIERLKKELDNKKRK